MKSVLFKLRSKAKYMLLLYVTRKNNRGVSRSLWVCCELQSVVDPPHPARALTGKTKQPIHAHKTRQDRTQDWTTKTSTALSYRRETTVGVYRKAEPG